MLSGVRVILSCVCVCCIHYLDSPKVYGWLNHVQKNYTVFLNDVQPILQVMLNSFPTWEVDSKGCQDVVLVKCIDCIKKLPFVANELAAINEAKAMVDRKASEQERIQTESNDRAAAKEILKFELVLVRSGRSKYEAATKAIEQEKEQHRSQSADLVKSEVTRLQSFHSIYRPTLAMDSPITEAQALQGKGFMIEAEIAFTKSLTFICQEWKVDREDVHCIFIIDNAARLGNSLDLLSAVGSFVRAHMGPKDLLVYEEPLASKVDTRFDYFQTKSLHSIFGEPSDAGLQPFKMQRLIVIRKQTGQSVNKPVATYVVGQKTAGVKENQRRYELEVQDDGVFDLPFLRRSALFDAPELNEVWDTRDEGGEVLVKYGWLSQGDRTCSRGIEYEQFLLEALTENIRSSVKPKVAFVFDMIAMQGERMMASVHCQCPLQPDGKSRR